MSKENWLISAEVFDAWRVIPRVVLAVYAGFVYHVTMYVLDWYTHLDTASRTLETSSVVGVVFTAIAGFTPWIFKLYIENGRNWDASNSTQVTNGT